MNELKNLQASGMTTMGSALKQVFDTLNINRMQTGIDMYGQGRYPFYLEPAVIVVISDGGKLTTQGSVTHELNLPMHSSVPGCELTREPFRWDQRLYALVLRMAGTPQAPAPDQVKQLVEMFGELTGDGVGKQRQWLDPEEMENLAGKFEAVLNLWGTHETLGLEEVGM